MQKRNVRAIAIPISEEVANRAQEAKNVKKDVGGTVDDAAISKQRELLESLFQSGQLIEPPFDLDVLAALEENNSELGQVIEAMETNVVGFGWSLEPIRTGNEEADTDLEDPHEDEWERFQLFLEYGNWAEGSGSLTSHMRKQRHDYETMGMCFMEIIVNGLGVPVGYIHAPAQRMRLTKTDDEPTTVAETVMIGRGERRRPATIFKRRPLRRYVQIDPTSAKLTYFKEFNDPRPISRDTGEVLNGEDAKNPALLANPMLYRCRYAPRTPYGLPRHIGTLLAILGGRCAEEVNYATFRNNQIPSMLLLVSGGQLTEETIERISDFAENVIQGDDNRSRFLIVEAEPDPAVDNIGPNATSAGTVRIEAKPLREAIHEDAMFVEYEKGNADKIRRNWRLPPIVIGASEDYSRATSDVARKLTEEQVFEPARREEDWEWNRVLRSMGMVFHMFKLSSPNVTNDEDLINIMAVAERTGAMTPKLATMLIGDILGFAVPSADKSDVPPNTPYSLTMAKEVKNMANTSEPGQRVTAMKSAEDPVVKLYEFVEKMFGLSRDEVADKTISVGELRRRALERMSDANAT